MPCKAVLYDIDIGANDAMCTAHIRLMDVLAPSLLSSLVLSPLWPQYAQHHVDFRTMHNHIFQFRYCRQGGAFLSTTTSRSHRSVNMDTFCPLDTRQFLLHNAVPRDDPTNTEHRGALELPVHKRGPCGLWPPLGGHHSNWSPAVIPLRSSLHPTHTVFPWNWGFTHG